MRKSTLLIGLGTINLLHALTHLIQFLQSLLLVSGSTDWAHDIFESPIFGFIWAIVGLFTLWVGIKDFKHHNSCKGDNL
jgi:hypothetical protein